MKRKHKTRQKERLLVGIVILKSCYAFACKILLFTILAFLCKYYETAYNIFLVFVGKMRLDSDLFVTNACEMTLKKEFHVNLFYVLYMHIDSC